MTSKQGESPNRILIADDSILTRQVLKKHLAALFPNASVTETKDGAQAISAIKNARLTDTDFDLILLDYMMPEKTGLEVLAYVRETDKSVPVYIISANIQDTTRNKAFELGCTSFIKKTLGADALCEGLGLQLSSSP